MIAHVLWGIADATLHREIHAGDDVHHAFFRSGLTVLLVVDGAMESGLFLAYVYNTRAVLQRGDLVVMDNLSEHQTSEVREILTEASAMVPTCFRAGSI